MMLFYQTLIAQYLIQIDVIEFSGILIVCVNGDDSDEEEDQYKFHFAKRKISLHNTLVYDFIANLHGI